MSEEYLLPSDLILKIISILPSKSVGRCRCVSKLWASLLASPYFSELFLTQSKTRRRFLFAVGRNEKEWALYSCPLQPQSQISSTKSNSSISVTAEFHMSLPKSSWFVRTSPSLSGLGLIYLSNMPDDNRPMLCNPSTRQLFSLPPLVRAKRSYFGYDPINKQLSVLGICFPLTSSSNRDFPSSYQILKLESGRRVVSWRSLECHLHHYPKLINICINGILYYIASFGGMNPCKIACFDFNSEEFKFVDLPWPCDPEILVNLKGKLGGVDLMGIKSSEERCNIELGLWVLEDVEKQEWSRHEYVLRLWDTKFTNMSICGVTTAGELVLSLWSTGNTVYVYFFNLETNILHRVEINGIEDFQRLSFCGWVDYVEDLKDLNWN